MKIIVYSPIPADATSFYRGFGPFNHLAKHNKDIEIINGSTGGFEYNWHTLQNVDCVFVQRASTSVALAIIKTCKTCKKFVWVDYDDDYINIPKINPRHELYANTVRQSIVRESMKLADVITVSTEPIKKAIVENVDGIDPDKVVVIKNATDETLFEINDFKNTTKTVLWRGGDTHVQDVGIYFDAITKCFDKYPEYTWVFMGHEFNDIIKHAFSKGQGNRVKTYEFKNDLMGYLDCLFEIRPEIMIVPLDDTEFNRAKSNISWQEGTIAGAVVLSSDLPEFHIDGILRFSDQKQLFDQFNRIVENKDFVTEEDCLKENLHGLSVTNLPRLIEVNQQRRDVLIGNVAKKVVPRNIEDTKPWDDRRFFEYALIHGFIQENEFYMKGHHDIADWLIKKFSPESVVEFGPGPGAMLERFLLNNVLSLGIESNEHFIDYFQERNPVLASYMAKVDITEINEDNLDKFDLGVSIECFEHIAMPEEWWDKFINTLSKKIKNFYFSSTPYQHTPEFDLQWGHINVRSSTDWINLFERNGWKLNERPKKITGWDMLFESLNQG